MLLQITNMISQITNLLEHIILKSASPYLASSISWPLTSLIQLKFGQADESRKRHVF